MPIGDDTYAWGRDLPHLQREGKTYFVTWCTRNRRILEPEERTVALKWCVHSHQIDYFLHVATVMPDHVHGVFTLYPTAFLADAIKLIKRNSGTQIGGPTWQRGYFDRILRSDEGLREKCEYVVNNPVRAGIVGAAEDYQWIWRSSIEGAKRG